MQPEITIELQHLAIVVALVLGFAFLINLHPLKKKKRLVVADLYTGPWQPEQKEPELWCASSYYSWLVANIETSENLEKLQELMPRIDGFYDKEFRVPISIKERQRYYSRLLEAYSKKEIQLETIPVVICKN